MKYTGITARESAFGMLSVPVFLLLYSFTGLTVILVLLASPFNQPRPVRMLLRIWARTIFLMMGKRVRVKGAEHIRPGTKYLLLANHASLFDITAIMAFYPGVSWFGREHLLRIPLFGRALRSINYVPMKAGNLRSAKGMINQLVEKSGAGTIAIFPEGTRTTDGNLLRFHKGFIHVLRATGMSVLPVTLNGMFLLKPKNRFSIGFNSRIEAVIHPPIDWKELEAMDDRVILERVRVVIESAYKKPETKI